MTRMPAYPKFEDARPSASLSLQGKNKYDTSGFPTLKSAGKSPRILCYIPVRRKKKRIFNSFLLHNSLFWRLLTRSMTYMGHHKATCTLSIQAESPRIGQQTRLDRKKKHFDFQSSINKKTCKDINIRASYHTQRQSSWYWQAKTMLVPGCNFSIAEETIYLFQVTLHSGEYKNHSGRPWRSWFQYQ